MPNARDMVRLNINNRKVAEDLKKLGVVRNKSKILRYNGCVPEKYLSSFFRGLIDGDGCIWTGNKRIQIQLASASRLFINDLLLLKPQWFSVHQCRMTNKTNRKICIIYNLYVKNGNEDRISFLRWIYKNKCDLYLRRKYAKVQDKIS